MAVQDSISGHWLVDTLKQLLLLTTAVVIPAMKQSEYHLGLEMTTSVTVQQLYLAVHRQVIFTPMIHSGMELDVALLRHAVDSIIHHGFANSSLKPLQTPLKSGSVEMNTWEMKTHPFNWLNFMSAD